MKMGCHAIFFLQRLNLVPRGYIILDGTHSLHGISGDSLENLQKLSVCEKFYQPKNRHFTLWTYGNHYSFYKEYDGSTIILLLKRIKGCTQGWGSLIIKVLWSPKHYKIEGNYFKSKMWVLYKLTTRTGGKG